MKDAGCAAEAGAAFERGDRGHFEEIVVTCAAEVFDVGFDERQEDAAFLEDRVRHAVMAKEFGSAALEPFERAGVVEGTHLIGLAVADAELPDMLEVSSGLVGCGVGHGQE